MPPILSGHLLSLYKVRRNVMGGECRPGINESRYKVMYPMVFGPNAQVRARHAPFGAPIIRYSSIERLNPLIDQFPASRLSEMINHHWWKLLVYGGKVFRCQMLIAEENKHRQLKTRMDGENGLINTRSPTWKLKFFNLYIAKCFVPTKRCTIF